MFDENDNIIQYYYDITFGNYIENDGTSWFFDLYLDVVMQPDGRILLLDEDELLEAFKNNIVNRHQYDLAHHTANSLINEIKGQEKRLSEFCMKYYMELRE